VRGSLGVGEVAEAGCEWNVGVLVVSCRVHVTFPRGEVGRRWQRVARAVDWPTTAVYICLEYLPSWRILYYYNVRNN
jgi:hypothetical protein